MKRRNNILVLDTSVLINDPDAFYKLKAKEIVIPTAVIKELDGMKKNPDPFEPRAKAARKIARTLDMLSSHEDLLKGAKLSSSRLLRVERSYVLVEGLASAEDNKIVGTAVALLKRCKNVMLLTLDANMRTIARLNGIRAEAPHPAS